MSREESESATSRRAFLAASAGSLATLAGCMTSSGTEPPQTSTSPATTNSPDEDVAWKLNDIVFPYGESTLLKVSDVTQLNALPVTSETFDVSEDYEERRQQFTAVPAGDGHVWLTVNILIKNVFTKPEATRRLPPARSWRIYDYGSGEEYRPRCLDHPEDTMYAMENALVAAYPGDGEELTFESESVVESSRLPLWELAFRVPDTHMYGLDFVVDGRRHFRLGLERTGDSSD